MVVAFECEDGARAGDRAREADGALDCLRSRRAEPNALGRRRHAGQPTRGFEFEFALPGVEDAAIELGRNHADHRGRRVPEYHRPHPQVIVDQPIAVDVDEDGTFRMIESQWRR